MKILLVTYFYAPEDSPGAFRWSPVAEHWAREGHEVDVISAWKPGLSRSETVNGVRVRRAGGGLVEALRKYLQDPGARDGTGAMGSLAGGVVRPARSLSKCLHDFTWKKVYWPDFACPWFFPAVRETRRLLARGGHDAMLSTSFPFTAHMVGLGAKRAHPGISWTVDMGDPFSFVEGTPSNNFSLYAGLNRRAESTVFSAADAIAVTPQAAGKYAEVFSESAAKMSPVPLPLPPLEGVEEAPRVFPEDGKTRLVYVGRLYRQVRTPDFMLRLFEMLLRERPEMAPELHLFGDVEECRESFRPYEALLGKSIFLHGSVGRERALRTVRDATVVVNIANDTRYQMPSKVMEYAVAGKPVLNLTKVEGDSAARFFEGYPAVLNLKAASDEPGPEQPGKLARFLDDAPTPSGPELRRWLAPFRVEAVADRYESLLRRDGSSGSRVS